MLDSWTCVTQPSYRVGANTASNSPLSGQEMIPEQTEIVDVTCCWTLSPYLYYVCGIKSFISSKHDRIRTFICEMFLT